MNDYYITQQGSRPDLAAIEINAPEGYIANKVLPPVIVSQKSGTVYYAGVTSDVGAQTGRSAGSAPTTTIIAALSTSYTCSEKVRRAGITPDEAKTFGGVDKAEVVGTKWAKRQVLQTLESAACAATLGTAASATFDATKILTQVQTALDAIRQYEGKTTLLTSTVTFKAMVQAMLAETSVGLMLSRVVSGGNPKAAVAGMSLESWKEAIAILFGVDQVLLGASDVWGASTYAGKIAIGKYDTDGDEISFKWRPVFGRSFVFLPENSTVPWEVQAVADRVNLINLITAITWQTNVVFHAGAQYVIGGITI